MKNKKYIRKSFWIHQYEKEEEFLSKMRGEGWRFTELHRGIPTKYEFEPCEPEEYSYQLDFVKEEEDTQDYHQLFRDAGWSEEMSWDGLKGKWYYFTKKCENGRKEKIYTDQQSKLELVNKLIAVYTGFFLLIVAIGMYSLIGTTQLWREGHWLRWIDTPLAIVMTTLDLWLIYCVAAMFRLRWKIKKEMEGNL